MDRIISKINLLMKTENKIIIAIDGSCASGKTTLANEISKLYDCNIIHMDDFFLPFEKRSKERLDEIGGNIDYERFRNEIADNIVIDSEFSYKKFNCSDGTFEDIFITPKKVNIIEGVYSMHPTINDIYNLKIFLKIDVNEKIKRLNNRSPEKLQRFIDEWIPMENRYFEYYKIEDKSDFVINNNSFIKI